METAGALPLGYASRAMIRALFKNLINLTESQSRGRWGQNQMWKRFTTGMGAEMDLADDGGSRFEAYVDGLASVIGHKAVVPQRTFTVLVPDHARKPIHIRFKPRSTVISKVHLSPHAGRESLPLFDLTPSPAAL